MVSSDVTGELSDDDLELNKKIIDTITKTALANGVAPTESRKLAEAIYDSLDAKSLVGNKTEYGIENINNGSVVACTAEYAEFYRTASEWATYDI